MIQGFSIHGRGHDSTFGSRGNVEADADEADADADEDVPPLMHDEVVPPLMLAFVFGDAESFVDGADDEELFAVVFDDEESFVFGAALAGILIDFGMAPNGHGI